jgi:hypothetical protein
MTSPKLPSERSFGILFAGVFAALAAYGFYKGWGKSVSSGWLIASAVVGLVTVFAPRLLTPFNKIWFRLGEFLGKIVSPIVLGIIFYGLLTPVGLMTRLFGRDELRLRRQAVTSCWIDRVPAGPASDSFKNQF